MGLPPAMTNHPRFEKELRRGRAFTTRRRTHSQRRAQTGRSIPQPFLDP